MRGVLEMLGLSLPTAPWGAEAKRVLDQIIDEIVESRREQNTQWEGVRNLKDSPRWLTLMDEPAAAQIEVAFAALATNTRGLGGGGSWDYWLRRDLPFAVARLILQKKSIQLSDAQIGDLLNAAASTRRLEYQFPVATVLGACERHLNGTRPEGAVRRALEAFADRVARERHPTQAARKFGMRAEAMLNPGTSGAAATLPLGAFAAKLQEWAGSDPARIALAAHLAEALDKSKPTKTWLASGAAKAMAAEGVWVQLQHWMEEETPDPAHPDLSYDLLKSLIWLSPPDLVQQIGRFCQVCYKKVPQVGARSIKLGNACLAALERMGDDAAAVAELSRLSREIKYGSVRVQIAERLARVAETLGISVADLEDRSLPTFGLGTDGRAEVSMGDYTAELELNAMEATLAWKNANGKVLRSAPKPVRDAHPEAVKDLKARLKDIEGARKSTVMRLEAGWIDRLDWDIATWRTLFDGHPVRRQITRALIWRVTDAGRAVVGMPEEDGWTGPTGSPVKMPDRGRISLWHPLDSDPDEVLAWRRSILARGVTQPIKQAHREVYVLTDAERRTEVYSNRFAAHILRQHQFKALCDAREWRYTLMGAHFDGHNTPHRPLLSQGLLANYTVDLVEDGNASASGIASHVATDQVSFLDDAFNRVPLIDVPPIVFSELMRDVDLFVAVASVANDPGWIDGGPEGRFGRYWLEHAFGDLTQSAETRKQLLEDVLPSLAIGDRCRVDGKFLVVQGRWNEYAIHLGSSNVQIRPLNRYLCIVPGRAARDPMRLPFAGDGTLSIILSKAYMLVDDHKITDKTILSQLDR